ncbi:hypothetical protein SAMN05216238_102395 [Lentibacillus persicus]|uniref:Uncharacterized protein n=1 Tax=Lentibacillus persicus TaxID=640948 RepID=A0A1I1TWL4_9BACI|nr:hypothetical protein [Lentibacillus persicus]SFD60843.1 hypothetical protein SAMN05216238_102395 [Lentibacillus persicus]
MRHYAILRLLLAGFFLYIAWPFIPEAIIQEAVLFWGVWLGFLILVIGANFATLLQMTEPPIMEQEKSKTRERA